jgi:hypothetical protein
MRTWSLAGLVAAAVVAGCSGASESSAAGGAALSGDSADHACHVILRTAEQSTGRDGAETDCTSGTCSFVVRGNVDADSSYGEPGVIYRVNGGAWSEATVARAEVASGWDFSFPAVDESQGSLQGSTIELIPYVTDTSGARHYDHNVVTDDSANYVLDDADSFSVDTWGACASTGS